MFHRMPFVLIAVILAAIILDPFIPIEGKQILYGISLSIKSLIIFLLPIIVFGLLFKAAVQLANNATRIILLILVCVCLSSFLCLFVSHYVGQWVYRFDLSLIPPQESEGLQTSWFLSFPKLISNDKAMIAGIVLGIGMGIIKRQKAAKIAANTNP